MRMRVNATRRLAVGLLAAGCGPCLAARAQSGPLPLPGASTGLPGTLLPNMLTPVVSSTYRIGHRDLLTAYVYQFPDITGRVRVSDDGEIQLPILNTPISAAGLTAPQLAHRIARQLQQAGIARDPQVQVSVQQVLSRPITVGGEVKLPLILQAARPYTLLEALASAGGLSPGHDTVTVLPAAMVYAIGSFQQPGAFPLQTGQPVTVLRIVALAHGIKDPASSNHARLIRPLADGGYQQIPINLDRILKQKAPDTRLAAGDIVYLPSSGKTKALQTVLSDAGSAAVIAVGYGIH
jgi:protein involved in polysaccharide export with SLBB domain